MSDKRIKYRRKHLDIEDELCAFLDENYSERSNGWVINKLIRALKNVMVEDTNSLMKLAATSAKDKIDDILASDA